MANLDRKIGANVYELMQAKKLDVLSFAKQLNYTEKDLRNVIEGKVFIPTDSLTKIAEFLNTTKHDLVQREPTCSIPELQYMKKFSNPEHLDMIIDLIDEYVACVEAVSAKK